MITLSCPEVYTYTYNELGENLTETTPNGTTTYTLNGVGKLTKKTIVGTNTNSITDYAYDGTTKLLDSSIYTDVLENGAITTTSLLYDGYKRLEKTTEIIPYATFIKQFNYDAFGRLNTETSTANAIGKTSAKTVQHTYKNGYAWQMKDSATQQVLWQTDATNSRGQLTNATMANGNIALANTYDQYGYINESKYDRLQVSPGNISTLTTAFEPIRSNLTSRSNSLFNWNENFTYDTQDRLTSFKNITGVVETQMYDNKGRITENAVGTYNYTNTSKPYQNTSVTPTPNALTYYQANANQIISYNTFKSPYQIEVTGVDKISFTYNDNNSRSTMFYGGLQTDKTQRPLRKYYSADGSMEIKHNITTGAIEFITYIGGDGYTAPIVLKSDGTTQNYLYLQRDYQGSIMAILDNTGQVLEKRLYDAWGNVLVQDGSGTILNVLTLLDRGYTGHEHLQSVGLINMNGRLYDAKLHRFLQPDNYVQDPSNTQNYNRYGYVLNNPLKYTDPSGEFISLIAAAVVAAFTYLKASHDNKSENGKWQWNPFKWSTVPDIGASVNGSFQNGGLNFAAMPTVTPTGTNTPLAVGPQFSGNINFGVRNVPVVEPKSDVGGNGNFSNEITAGQLGGGLLINSFLDMSGKYLEKAHYLLGTYHPSNSINFNGQNLINVGVSAYEKGYKASINQIKNINGVFSLTSKALNAAGYIDGAIKFYEGSYLGGLTSMSNNYAAYKIGVIRGWGYGLAYTASYTYFENTLPKSELYNRMIFGKGSATYNSREHFWYKTAFKN